MIRISCSQRVLRIFLQKFREPVEEIIIISFFLGQKNIYIIIIVDFSKPKKLFFHLLKYKSLKNPYDPYFLFAKSINNFLHKRGIQGKVIVITSLWTV